MRQTRVVTWDAGTDMEAVDALAHVRTAAMEPGCVLVARGSSFDDLSVRAEKFSSLLNGNFCDEEIELLRVQIAKLKRHIACLIACPELCKKDNHKRSKSSM
jgi:hypothetical protein